MDEMEICKFPCHDRECIIAPKIFDQCRIQVCLTPSTIGPARVCSNMGCHKTGATNDAIVPPSNAVSVAVRGFCVSDVTVINKNQNSIRCGYWDVTVKFNFTYCLVFFDSDSCEIANVNACSSYTTTLTLYGGENMCVSMFNELFSNMCKNGPFVSVEANGMALAACLSYPCPSNNSCGNNCGCGNGCNNCGNGCNNCGNGCNNCGNGINTGAFIKGCACTSPNEISPNPIAVNVTIGLFAVVRLFRLSNISIESLGDCVPEDCSAVSPETMDPCEFFDNLDFPLNLFAPQSDYIPAVGYDTTTEMYGGCQNDCNCGCGHHNNQIGSGNTGCNCGCNHNR